jgi:hypothetical protein
VPRCHSNSAFGSQGEHPRSRCSALNPKGRCQGESKATGLERMHLNSACVKAFANRVIIPPNNRGRSAHDTGAARFLVLEQDRKSSALERERKKTIMNPRPGVASGLLEGYDTGAVEKSGRQPQMQRPINCREPVVTDPWQLWSFGAGRTLAHLLKASSKHLLISLHLVYCCLHSPPRQL